MNTKSIEIILDRAMSDANFAAQMLINPREALANYNLTATEISQFESLSRADFDAFANATPEERKSFGWVNHNESILKVRKGVNVNHNQTAAIIHKGGGLNHNQSALKVRKGGGTNHNQALLKVK